MRGSLRLGLSRCSSSQNWLSNFGSEPCLAIYYMSSRRSLPLAPLGILLGITALACAGGLLESCGVIVNLQQRLAAVTVGVLFTGTGIWAWNRSQQKHQQTLLRQLNDLCQLSPQELDESLGSSSWPNSHETSRAEQNVLLGVAETIQKHLNNLTEAEHDRAGAEVRSRRLATECQQLRDIFASLTDPVLAVDPYGQVLLSNPSAQRLLGVDATRDEKQILDQLTSCEELVGLLTETRRRKGNTVRQTEVDLEDQEGGQSSYKIVCRPIPFAGDFRIGDSGCVQGAVAVLTNISGQRAIQKRNAEFVSSVSHEMKTPLASIKAYVELLADGDAQDEAEREEFIGVINAQADRLQRLVENLLNLARIEAGVVNVNKTPRSLNEVLQEAAAVIAPAAEQRQQKFVTDLSPLYLGVLADHDMLLQAAINLASNAVKYTRPGGTITLRSRQSDQEVVFEIQDTGVGLSEEDREKVFQKFYRVSKDKDMAPGTGLGLPLVKHIIEDVHNGRIEVESQLGVGSTFRVSFPAVRQIQG